MELARSEGEIWALVETMTCAEAEGTTKYPGMTYEQGVLAAVMWLIGEWDAHPYEEDE